MKQGNHSAHFSNIKLIFEVVMVKCYKSYERDESDLYVVKVKHKISGCFQ